MNTKNLKDRGFTLIELMITMVMLSIIVVAIVSVVMNSQKAKRNTELISEAQQTGRILVDMLSEDIRSAGYGANAPAGHLPIVYAGPFDIMISANLAPITDNPVTHGSPQAIKPGVTPLPGDSTGTDPLYDGGIGFTDGAETIRYSFDSDNNATVDASDRGDDLEERLTRNVDLYSLTRQIYGYNATTDDNTGTNLPVGMALSNFPARSAGSQVPPMFQYWILNTATGLDELWGDTDKNGSLSPDEVDALYAGTDGGVVPSASLRYVTKVGIAVTTATKSPNSKNTYEEFTINTITAITRNREVKAGKVISGRVGVDGDNNQQLDDTETGIQNIKVTNETDGQVTFTAADGSYLFNVEAKKQTIAIALPTLSCASTIGYKVVPPIKTDTIVDATSENKVVNFPLSIFTPGKVSGYVCEDVDNDGGESTESGIPGCIVYLKSSGKSITTDADGYYCLAAEQPVNDSIICIPAVHDPEYIATIPAAGRAAVALSTTAKTQNFGFVAGPTGTIKGKVYLDKNGNGYCDVLDSGIAGVEMAITRGNTSFTEEYIRFPDPVVTKDDGTFECNVIANPTEKYIVYEIDPAGYFSTTPNRYDVGIVAANAVVNCPYFGDKMLAAVTIQAANVLSMTVGDLHEWEGGTTFTAQTANRDTDIVLGTRYGTTGNIRGWFNKRYLYNSATTMDIYQLFEPSFTGARNTYAFQKTTPNNADIKAIACDTLNEIAGTKKSGSNNIVDVTKLNQRYSRSRKDIVIGVYNNLSISDFNVAVWPSMDTCKYRSADATTWDSLGQSSDTINAAFKLKAGGDALNKVNALALANFGGDGFPDIVAGYTKSSGVGGFQLWINTQRTSYPSISKYETRLFPDSTGQIWETGLGEVLSLAAVDIVGDTKIDLVVGTKETTSLPTGSIIIYKGSGTPATTPKWFSKSITLNPMGEVVALKVIDFNLDGKKDIIAAVKDAASEGQLQVWLQDGSGNFGLWNDADSRYVPSYMTDITGYEPVCMDAGVLKWTSNLYPHIVVGVRKSETSGKALLYDCTDGILPGDGANLALTSPTATYGFGAVAAVKIADFDMDGKRDISVAEKTSETEGNLVFYYGK